MLFNPTTGPKEKIELIYCADLHTVKKKAT